ncbi:hypothetical protein [Actinocorallia populi]|uniref:hypothetical protein n=1 Tax=Actinocorallia populi TaxID=2079200 RepID=UPI000D087F1E|nr:hypothetical protein [Actinocorallia populi]
MRHTIGRGILALGTAGTCLAVLSGASSASAAAAPAGDLCLRAQHQTAGIDQAAFQAAGGELSNVEYPDKTSFEKSKPTEKPLVTGSYTTYEDEAGTLPRQVRCKTKRSDHLQLVYGQDAAGPEQQCKVVNETTLQEVDASFTEAERASLAYPASKVVVDRDVPAFTGWDWLWEFPAAYEDRRGRLHLPSRSLSVPWTWNALPASFRGQHYCTFIAPPYLRRLMLGQAVL